MGDDGHDRESKTTIAAPVPPPDQQTEPTKEHQLPCKYPRWIGQKFNPEGQLLPFPGNTIICHLQPKSPLYSALLHLYNSLKIQKFSSLYVLLPPASWHMTIFEGVSSQIRQLGVWPADLPLEAPLSECSTLLEEKLRKFPIDNEQPFKMAIAGFEPLTDGIALKVVPIDPAEEKRMRRLRDRISETLHVAHPGHESYSFHVSLSYMLRFLDDHDHQMITNFLQEWRATLPDTFELGVPEFCIFDDMFAFDKQFLLGTHS
jgi:hypothetical protein